MLLDLICHQSYSTASKQFLSAPHVQSSPQSTTTSQNTTSPSRLSKTAASQPLLAHSKLLFINQVPWTDSVRRRIVPWVFLVCSSWNYSIIAWTACPIRCDESASAKGFKLPISSDTGHTVITHEQDQKGPSDHPSSGSSSSELTMERPCSHLLRSPYFAPASRRFLSTSLLATSRRLITALTTRICCRCRIHGANQEGVSHILPESKVWQI